MSLSKERLIEIIDAACWAARKRYGHDDNGIEEYDENGVDLDIDTHPQAVEAAETIIKEFSA